MKTTSIFIVLLMFFGCNTSEQEIIIAPRDYKGYILVIFNQENGQPIKYEGKKRVYEIPQNGILKTQFSINSGLGEPPIFYYEKIAPESRLPSSMFYEFETLPIDTVVGFEGATGSVRKNDYNEERVRFAEFYIGTKSDIEQAMKEKDKLTQMDILKLAE